MRAVQIRTFGEPGTVLELADLPEPPAPAAGACRPSEWSRPRSSRGRAATSQPGRPKEFTGSEDRDPWIGRPWRKSMPARLEAIAAAA